MSTTKRKAKAVETRLHIVDVSNWLNRAYFAAPPLTTSNGVPTGALKAFCEMVYRLYLDLESDNDYFMFPFDCSRSTSWRLKYTQQNGLDDYKGNRDTTSDRKADLKPQFGYAKKILELMGFQCPVTKSFEADDLIGTAAHRFSALGVKVYIYSRDKDFVQCLNPNVTLIQPQQANSPERIFRFNNSHERYVSPDKMVEFLMMVGDSSDHVAGVQGIGEKTAVKILNEGTLQEAMNAGKYKALTKVTAEYMDKMRDLVQIIEGAPCVPYTLDKLRQKQPNNKALRKLKAELEFKKLFHL